MSEPFDFEGETDLELLGGVIDKDQTADPEPEVVKEAEPAPEVAPEPNPKQEYLARVK